MNKSRKVKLNIVSLFHCFIASLLVLFLPFTSNATMRSASYIINENVNHTFDGPVISGVSHSVSGVAVTVAWNTDVAANSFVVYDTSSGFVNSKEQGTSQKIFTNHSVVLSGLSENTTYYYRVKSERVNGGESLDTTLRSFTTGDDGLTPDSEIPQASGGGVIIIDKTDKTAPVISNVLVNIINSQSVEISWDTDEAATSFVEYGGDIEYGFIAGGWNEVVSHSVLLDNLKPQATYHFRVLSSDSWGNLAEGEDKLFNTLEGIVDDISTSTEDVDTPEEIIDQSVLAEASKRALDFIKRLFPGVSLNDPNKVADIKTIEELSSFIPAPIMSGEPRVKPTAKGATVTWYTDIDATSQIAISPESEYQLNVDEPYRQIIGDTENLTTEHIVELYGLEPSTTYHYQLRSKGSFGPVAKSRDFVFVTLEDKIEIVSFLAQVKDDNTASVKWVTNKESNSQVQITPYINNELALDQAKTFKDNDSKIIHEIEISEFQPGVFYDIDIISADEEGNTAREKIDRFSTQEDDLAPEISHIKANSTVFLDKANKTQTVISWLTNEPTMGTIFYQKGVHGGDSELSQKTELNENFTKEHVFVITSFKPGIVYSFKVTATDSGGNTTKSKVHTFMTAKQKESIIQVIIRILEDTFGWLKDVM